MTTKIVLEVEARSGITQTNELSKATDKSAASLHQLSGALQKTETALAEYTQRLSVVRSGYTQLASIASESLLAQTALTEALRKQKVEAVGNLVAIRDLGVATRLSAENSKAYTGVLSLINVEFSKHVALKAQGLAAGNASLTQMKAETAALTLKNAALTETASLEGVLLAARAKTAALGNANVQALMREVEAQRLLNKERADSILLRGAYAVPVAPIVNPRTLVTSTTPADLKTLSDMAEFYRRRDIAIRIQAAMEQRVDRETATAKVAAHKIADQIILDSRVTRIKAERAAEMSSANAKVDLVAAKAYANIQVETVALEAQLQVAKAKTTALGNANVQALMREVEAQHLLNKERAVSILSTRTFMPASTSYLTAGVLQQDTNAALRNNTSAQVAATAAATAAVKPVKDLEKATLDYKSAVRGTAGALGGLWLTYGKDLVLLASFFVLTKAIKDTVAVTMEFERSLKLIQAVSGQTSEQMNKIGDALLSINTIQGPRELAEGLRVMVKAGVDVQEAIKGIRDISILAMSDDQGLKATAEMVTKVMTVFELKGKDLAMVTDTIGYAAAQSNMDLTDFAGGMAQSTELATVMNLSLKEQAAAFMILSKHGIDGTKMGSSFRTSMLRLLAPTEQAAQMMEKIDFQAKNADGSLKNLTEILIDLNTAVDQLAPGDRLEVFRVLGDLRTMKALVVLSDHTKEVAKNIEELDTKAKGFTKTLEEIGLKSASIAWKDLKSDIENVVQQFTKWAEVDAGLGETFKTIGAGVTAISDAIKLLNSTIDESPELKLFFKELELLTRIDKGLYATFVEPFEKTHAWLISIREENKQLQSELGGGIAQIHKVIRPDITMPSHVSAPEEVEFKVAGTKRLSDYARTYDEELKFQKSNVDQKKKLAEYEVEIIQAKIQNKLVAEEAGLEKIQTLKLRELEIERDSIDALRRVLEQKEAKSGPTVDVKTAKEDLKAREESVKAQIKHEQSMLGVAKEGLYKEAERRLTEALLREGEIKRKGLDVGFRLEEEAARREDSVLSAKYSNRLINQQEYLDQSRALDRKAIEDERNYLEQKGVSITASLIKAKATPITEDSEGLGLTNKIAEYEQQLVTLKEKLVALGAEEDTLTKILTIEDAGRGKSLKEYIGDLDTVTRRLAEDSAFELRAATMEDSAAALEQQLVDLKRQYEDTVLALSRSKEIDAPVKIDEEKEFFDESTRLAKKHAADKIALEGDWVAGAKKALVDYGATANDTFSYVGEIVTSTLQTMEDALLEFVTTGKFNFRDFASTVLKEIARIMIAQQVAGLAKWGGSLLGSTVGSTASSGASSFSYASDYFGTIKHSGGIVGEPSFGDRTFIASASLFNGAPRLHKGLASDEFPAILQRGEQVIPKNQVGSTRGGVVVNIGSIVVEKKEGATGQEDSQETAKLVAALIKREVKMILADEQRPGGILNRQGT